MEDDAQQGAALHSMLIKEEHSGWKLAKFVSTVLPGFSRNAAAASTKEGTIRVNGAIAGANKVIEVGDRVEVHVEPPAETKDGPTLSAEEIISLVDERARAKILGNFAKADEVHIHICACINKTCIYTYSYIYIHIYIYMEIYVHMSIPTYMRKYKHAYKHEDKKHTAKKVLQYPEMIGSAFFL